MSTPTGSIPRLSMYFLISPYPWLFHSSTMMGVRASTALASSGKVNCKPPSPIRHTTGPPALPAARRPNHAPTAAGNA